jgi:excinuclease UvrABC nuclease subunit
MKIKWLTNEFLVDEPATTTWNDVGGIYIFTGLDASGRWKPYYIGQARSFKDRIPNHENWRAAARLVATHVHAMVVSLAANRDKIEAELVEAYQPALNVQLK